MVYCQKTFFYKKVIQRLLIFIFSNTKHWDVRQDCQKKWGQCLQQFMTRPVILTDGILTLFGGRWQRNLHLCGSPHCELNYVFTNCPTRSVKLNILQICRVTLSILECIFNTLHVVNLSKQTWGFSPLCDFSLPISIFIS